MHAMQPAGTQPVDADDARPVLAGEASADTRQLVEEHLRTDADLAKDAVAFDGSRITFLMSRDAPIVGGAWLATGLVMWAWHLMVRRRLRVSGL